MTHHQSDSHEEERWAQPNSTAASDWDDGVSQNPKTAGNHMGQVEHNDYSQWQAPIEEGRRERSGQARGRGPGKGRARGNAQQKPPAKPKVSDSQPYCTKCVWLAMHMCIELQSSNGLQLLNAAWKTS